MISSRTNQIDGYWLKGIVVGGLGFFGFGSRTCDVFVKKGESEESALERKREELKAYRSKQ